MPIDQSQSGRHCLSSQELLDDLFFFLFFFFRPSHPALLVTSFFLFWSQDEVRGHVLINQAEPRQVCAYGRPSKPGGAPPAETASCFQLSAGVELSRSLPESPWSLPRLTCPASSLAWVSPPKSSHVYVVQHRFNLLSSSKTGRAMVAHVRDPHRLLSHISLPFCSPQGNKRTRV